MYGGRRDPAGWHWANRLNLLSQWSREMMSDKWNWNSLPAQCSLFSPSLQWAQDFLSTFHSKYGVASWMLQKYEGTCTEACSCTEKLTSVEAMVESEMSQCHYTCSWTRFGIDTRFWACCTVTWFASFALVKSRFEAIHFLDILTALVCLKWVSKSIIWYQRY